MKRLFVPFERIGVSGIIVLGIDPGYALMGWGVVEANGSHMKLLGYGCIETKAGTPMQHRLRTLQLGVRDLTLMYRPDEVAFEELFFSKNITTGMAVSMARSMRRSLMFTVKSLKPMASRARAVTSISSISALMLSSPRISISHCTSSRMRPF